MPTPLADLAQALLSQELASNPEQFRAPSPAAVDLGLGEGREMKPLSPRLAAWMGGLADAGSTYHFLKQGTRSEDNALMGGVASPMKGLLGALGGLAASRAALAILKKKAPGVGKAAEANLGALQMGYAANNISHAPISSSQAYRQQMLQALER